MQIFNLSPDAAPVSNVNISEDVRTALIPVANSPFGLTASTSTPILPANPQRAIATIMNTGSKTAYLREGTTAASTTNFSYVLLPNRLLTFGADVRYLGAVQAICGGSDTTTLIVNESTIVS